MKKLFFLEGGWGVPGGVEILSSISSQGVIFCECNRISLKQAEIEIGDGLPDIRLTGKCLEALKQAGFEVSASYDSFF